MNYCNIDWSASYLSNIDNPEEIPDNNLSVY